MKPLAKAASSPAPTGFLMVDEPGLHMVIYAIWFTVWETLCGIIYQNPAIEPYPRHEETAYGGRPSMAGDFVFGMVSKPLELRGAVAKGLEPILN
jgi:hypothetical protein